MNICEAISAMKMGKHVYRQGWNGKGLYVVFIDAREEEGTSEPVHCAGYFVLLRPTEMKMQPGWNASTPDLLADDWCVLEDDAALVQAEAAKLEAEGGNAS